MAVKVKKTKVKEPQIETHEVEAAKGESLYHVYLEGVRGHGAVIPARSKDEAKAEFYRLFGIIATERIVRCLEVDEDHGLCLSAAADNPRCGLVVDAPGGTVRTVKQDADED